MKGHHFERVCYSARDSIGGLDLKEYWKRKRSTDSLLDLYVNYEGLLGLDTEIKQQVEGEGG